jgi:exosortase
MRNRNVSLQMPSRSSLVLTLKIVIILAAILMVFHQDLTIVASDALQSELTSYILAIPFLLIYLIYRKRKMLRAVIPLENQDQPKATRHLPLIAGILLSTTAILLYWHGSYTFTPLEYHMLTLPVFAAGLILILFNVQILRQLAFPLAFLIFLTPPPIEILRSLGSILSVISSEASYTIVKSLGVPSVLSSEYGNPIIEITRPDGNKMSFALGIACSGIYSLLSFLVFAVFIAYVIRDKPWKKLAIFIIGLSVVYLLNITRIATILIIGYNYGEKIALELFHLLGGWVLIFVGTLLLLVFSEKIFHTQIFHKPVQKCSECKPKHGAQGNFCLVCGKILKPASIKFRRTDIVKIAAIIIVVGLLTSIQAPVFAITQGPAPIVLIDTPAGQQVSTEILPKIPGYELRFAYREREFEVIAKQDMTLVYYYLPANKSQKTVFATIEIASSRQYLYSWELCVKAGQIYPIGPQEVNQIDLRDIQLIQDPPVIARYFVFEYTKLNETEAVLYWFESAAFQVNSTSQQKQVKISLITYPETLQELPSTEKQAVTLGTAIALYWQPIKTWSQIALLLSQNGAPLAMTTATLLLPLTALYLFKNKKRAEANLTAYQKLSTTTRQIIDITLQTEKTKKPTLNEIATTYKDKIGKPIEDEELFQKLSETEETGIIKSEIANIQDEPAQIWKSRMKLF